MMRTLRATRVIWLSLAATVLIAGCGTAAAPSDNTEPSEDTPSPKPTRVERVPLAALDLYPDPRAATGASTALSASDVIEPITENPKQNLPATVTSYNPGGEAQITVTDTSRALALDIAGSLAGTVWGLGLGETLVGRDISTTFPGTEDLPLVTPGGHSVNAEAVLQLRPTLVITDGSVGPRDVLEQLRESGIAVIFLKNEPSFAGAAQLARDVSAVFGVSEIGEQLADRITQEVNEKIAEIAAIAPSDPDQQLRIIFLYLRGSAGIYYLFGEESGANHLIDGLAGRDVATEIGWLGNRPMTDEAILDANPDLILVMTKGIESAGGVDGLLEAKPAIALTTAGQNKRFVDMADGEVLSFGPRSALILDALARAVYAKAAD